MAAASSGMNYGLTASLFSQGIGSIGGAYAQALASKAQGRFQVQQAEINKEIAGIYAADAIQQGNKDSLEYQKQVKGLTQDQRAAYASQGVDLNSSVVSEVSDATRYQAKLDEIKIRNNAWKKAWGYQVEAANLSSGAAFSKLAASNASTNTLLTGGINAISNFGQSAYYGSKGR